MTETTKSGRSLQIVRFTVEASIALLFLQLLLGMWVNLYASFPSHVAGVNPLDLIFTEGPVLLTIHFLVGFTLGILAIAGLVAAVRIKSKGLIVLEAAALGSVFLAGESGIEFILGWYQEDVYSFTMTVGFVLLMGIYFWTSRVTAKGLPPSMPEA